MERGSKNISLHSNSQRFRTTMDNSTLHSMQKCTCTTANLPVVFCFKPTAYNLHFSESNAGEKKRPIRRNKILKTFPSFDASEGAEKERRRHIAPWFWKYTKTYIVTLLKNHVYIYYTGRENLKVCSMYEALYICNCFAARIRLIQDKLLLHVSSDLNETECECV